GTLNVLLASHAAAVKRVIYASSSSVYGNKEVMPFTEDMTPEPLSPYALQKLLGELQCAFFSRLYNLETVSLRYFNVYGSRAPGEGPYALVIPKFLAARQKGQALTITGDGTQSRDFTHVRDIVRANLLAAVSSNVGKGEVINVGGGHPRTVLEVAELIGGPRVFIEPRIEPKHTFADITRARELLGWEPKEVFGEGVAELKRMRGLQT
ncbi:MAG: NAD-dependent epimerase/dehydratase family protein, partial [bacterium]|nr:NAD-dependent epimerase/dehydratase family protein [bacterium]